MSRLARRLERLRAAAGQATLDGPQAEVVRPEPDLPTEPADPPEARPRASPAPTDVDSLRQAIRRVLERHASREARAASAGAASSLERHAPMPGEVVDTPRGPVRRVMTYHEPHHAHGRVPIAGAKTADAAALAALAAQPELRDLDVSGALYLDTETTGLAGGTGTIPFLVGLGWFEDDSFVVEQLLLEQLHEEPALMARVRERYASASCLVTFNGKAYDAPLLATRAVLSRIDRWIEPPHVDLLHLARRTYRRRLDTFRLVELERRVLGFEREHDIDGAEVPGAYWSFLRSSRPSFLLPVIEHNLHDIVALAALLCELVGGYAQVDARHEPEDQVCRALWALRANDHARVEAFAAAVGDGGASSSEVFAACMAAATAARRRRDVAAERRWLDDALGQAATPEDRRRARLERAKHFEHRARDLGRALAEVEALCALDASEDVTRRRARIARRIDRAPNRVADSSARLPSTSPTDAGVSAPTASRLRSELAMLRGSPRSRSHRG